ncbi:unnamed protein product [Dovyalis caffra]|uniref:AT-hook motif nuclear-localized protein n=1 Tax=Dovyalis caffra TaxID=77055 RepID=A0AAV1SP96_9ROSI|nr:unnamed protein product [Dovyalis caffra]
MRAREPSDGGSYGGGMANMKLAFSDDTTAVYKPIMPPSFIASNTTDANDINDNFDHVVSSSNGGGGSRFDGLNMNLIEPTKRKRGRPRKYSLLESSHREENLFINSNTEFQSSPIMSKKPRGRPPGSGGKNQRAFNAHGSTGLGFTPHVIAVKTGEDVFSKIMAFSQNGGSGLCILSANGAVSNVTLHQATASCGTITYEVCR